MHCTTILRPVVVAIFSLFSLKPGVRCGFYYRLPEFQLATATKVPKQMPKEKLEMEKLSVT